MGSSDRTKVIVMLAAVAVLVAGGLFWFFKIHQPKQRISEAQEEIAAYDTRWIEARNCMLGKSPASSKVSEALAIRELSSEPFERKACAQLVGALSRGEATDTRVPAVEEAWRVLDKSASRVAMSFISHVDPAGDGKRRKPDPLPVALDEMEAAYTALRKAADLPPLPAPMDKRPLPAAQLIPVDLAGKRMLSVQEPYVTSRAGLLAFGTVEGAEVQLQLVANKPPLVQAVGAATQRAIPDGTWGARAIPDAVEIGTLDAKGVVATPTKLDLPGPTQVIAVVGRADNGVVVFGAGNQLVVARGDKGKWTPDKPLTVRSMSFATDAATGYTTIVWVDDKNAMHAIHLDPEKLDTKIDDLGQDGFPKLMCLAGKTAWVQYMLESDLQTIELSPGQHANVPSDDHGLMGCSPGGAVLFLDGVAPSYRRCADGKCEATVSKTQKERVPVALVPNGVVAVEARQAVLAVRKDGPTDYYTVPNGFVPLVSMTDGSQLDVLGWHADGLAIVRVSAR